MRPSELYNAPSKCHVGLAFGVRSIMCVQDVIAAEFAQVAREMNKPLRTLTSDTPLLDTGLDSLCFAIIVARLEDRLEADPFGASDSLEFPITFGDLVKLYETVAV